MQTSAKEVLAQVARDLKSRGLTHEDIARDLKYKTRQSVGTILTAGRYMTQAQARRFSETYGYYYDFLVSGAGSLTGPVEDVETTYLIPQYALLLRPFETKEEFEEAFTMFIESVMVKYGASDVHKFLVNTAHFISTLYPATEEEMRRMIYAQKRGSHDADFDEKSIDDKVRRSMEWQNSEQYKQNQAVVRERLLNGIYDTYSQMVEKAVPKD